MPPHHTHATHPKIVTRLKRAERHPRAVTHLTAHRNPGPAPPPGRRGPRVAAPGGPPGVDGGRARRVDEGAPAPLNGAATAPAGRSRRRLSWRQVDGPEAVVDGARDQNRLTVVTPQVDADTALTFELEAEDSSGALGRDTVTVTVVDTFNNPLPTVDAGGDRTVTAGERVMLNGAARDDGAVVSVLWRVTPGGPALTLEGDDRLQVAFTAPPVAGATDVELSLTAVDDQGGRASDRVTVTILPAPANAAPRIDDAYADPGVASGGETARLLALASDPDNNPLQYRWTQRDDGAPALAIDNADTGDAKVTLPLLEEATAFGFVVTVSDGELEASRTVTLQVTPRAQASPGVFQCVLRARAGGGPPGGRGGAPAGSGASRPRCGLK